MLTSEGKEAKWTGKSEWIVRLILSNLDDERFGLWMDTPKASLEQLTPRSALASGKTEQVVRLALTIRDNSVWGEGYDQGREETNER